MSGDARMEVAEAQRDLRGAYLGGSMGQLVSGLLWLGSAILATRLGPRSAILFLVAGGFFIFPLTQLTLRLLGHAGRASPGNPLNALGMQVAFVLPLTLPVVGAVAIHDLNWFYPAFMVVLGAHYLPFVTLYGMRLYAGLAGILVTAGVGIGLYAREGFALGAWVTAGVLLVFAALARVQALGERPRAGG